MHARQMHESFRGAAAGLTAAVALHHLMEVAIDALAVLAPMGEQRSFLLFAHGGYVHVIGWVKAQGLSAEIDFVVIQFESPALGQPCAKGGRGGGLMV